MVSNTGGAANRTRGSKPKSGETVRTQTVGDSRGASASRGGAAAVTRSAAIVSAEELPAGDPAAVSEELPVAKVATAKAPPAAKALSAKALPAKALPTKDQSTEDILRRYRRRRSKSLRDLVVERHRTIVEAMARALAGRLPPAVDAQDLVHAGMWGLMQAIASYEPERCDRFTAFMRIRVRGAMLDELRQMDYLPRLIRRRLRQHNEATMRLRMELEREPTHDELAADLGISPEMLVQWQDQSRLRLTRNESEQAHFVDQIVDEGNESPIEPIVRAELLELVRAALQPIEWKVLRMLYLEELTGKQVARRLRLSASRICQIHGRVLERLKTQLATLAAG